MLGALIDALNLGTGTLCRTCGTGDADRRVNPGGQRPRATQRGQAARPTRIVGAVVRLLWTVQCSTIA